MKRKFSTTLRPELAGLLLALSLLVSACSSAKTTGAPAAVLPATGGQAVQVMDSPEFGQILVTPDGKTLYTNTVDSPDNLRCTTGACTGFWPPYTVSAEPTAAKELTGSLETVTRPDGSKQVTYNSQPLYTFYQDKQPGDIKGNGFTDFGGTWHVVTVGGTPAPASSPSTPAPGGYPD